MQFQSIKNGTILQYFRPSLSYHLSLRSLFCLCLSGRFAQVLLYYVQCSFWHLSWNHTLHIRLNSYSILSVVFIKLGRNRVVAKSRHTGRKTKYWASNFVDWFFTHISTASFLNSNAMSDQDRECSGSVVECLPRDRGFEPHRRHCVVVLEQDTFILA